MKILHSFYSALPITLLILSGSMSAQQRSLQILQDQSTARVFLGTAENPTSFDVGMAKVTGEVRLSSDDISASRFNLAIYSADLRDKKVYGEQSLITFQSERVERRKDGELEVGGELTVTQVVAYGVAGIGEEGAGPLSANSKPMRTTHKAVFVFSGLEPTNSTSNSPDSDMLPAQDNKAKAGMLVTASTAVDGESFPELLFAVQDVAWPPATDDNNCGSPSAPDQNDSAATCVQLTSQAQPGGIGVGLQQEEPAGNLVTIKFHLTLAGTESNSARQ